MFLANASWHSFRQYPYFEVSIPYGRTEYPVKSAKSKYNMNVEKEIVDFCV